MIASPGSAANAYTLTSLLSAPGCDTGCDIVHFGEVAVTDKGTGTLAFQVTLFENYEFVGGANTFAFNLKGSPTISLSSFTPTPALGSFTGSNTIAGHFQLAGFGPFMYSITAPEGGPDGQSLNFEVNAPGGLTLADLALGNAFAAHLCPVTMTECDTDRDDQTDYAFTFIGGGFTANETPLPAALPLFGSVLGAGYLISNWRRRRNAVGVEAL
jgi:hypothetical protein